MPRTRPKPEVQDIVALALRGFGELHAGRLALYRRAKLLYDRKFQPFKKPPDPNKWKVIRPGTAKSIIDKAALHIHTDNPVVKSVPRDNTSARAQDDADLQEKWAAGVLEGISNSSAIAPLWATGKNSFFGAGIIKGPTFDFELWGDRPERTEGMNDADWRAARSKYQIDQAENFAYIVENIDPEQVIWDPDNPMNPGWAIQKYDVSVERLLEMFPDWTNPKGIGTFRHATVLEYWDKDWHAKIVDNEELTFRWGDAGEDGKPKVVKGVIENIYGYNPYQVIYGVWGAGGTAVEDQAVPMLFTAEDALIEEAVVESVKSWNTINYGYQRWVSENPTLTQEELESFSAILTKDEKGDGPKPAETPKAPPWLDTRSGELSERIINETLSPALSGIQQSGTTSGHQTGLQIGEGRLLFEPITKSLNQAATTILRRAAFIHEHLIGEPMTIWAKPIDGRQELVTIPDTIWRGSYRLKVEFEPVDPTRDDRRAMLGLNLFAQSAIDWWALQEEYLRNPDASGTLRRLLVWKALQDPSVMAILLRVAIEEWGMEDEQQAMTEAGASTDAGQRSIGDFPIAGGDVDPLAPGIPRAPDEAGGPGELARSAPTRGSLPGLPVRQGRSSPVGGFGQINDRDSGPRT